MQVFKIDNKGYYIEPVIIIKNKKVPDDCVEIMPPQPCYKPRWNGTEWVEEGTPPEPQPHPPSKEERLEALEQAMLEIVMGGM